jgi:hypothetical protein
MVTLVPFNKKLIYIYIKDKGRYFFLIKKKTEVPALVFFLIFIFNNNLFFLFHFIFFLTKGETYCLLIEYDVTHS